MFNAALMLFIFNLTALGGDISTLNKNLLGLSSFRYKADDRQIPGILIKINDKGKFNDINYAPKNKAKVASKVVEHLKRTQMLCYAYCNKNSKYYRSPKLKKQIYSVIRYWVTSNPVDKNWWHRAIGFPKKFAPAVLPLYEEMKKDQPKLLNLCSNYLINNWNGKIDPDSNSIQIAQVALIGASIGGNSKLVKIIADKAADSLIKIQTGLNPKRGNYPCQGPLPDMGYNAHNLSGVQLYWGTYGWVYMNTNAWFAKALQNTKFQLRKEKLELIANLYLEGLAWIFYCQAIDINSLGRGLTRKDPAHLAPAFKSDLKTFSQMVPNEYKKSMEELYQNITKGKNTLSGNKAFWNFDFMVHRRKNYYMSVRMSSKRTVCNESGLKEGISNFYTGSGVTYIMTKGNEYNLNLLRKWNWRRLPGITAAQAKGKLPLVNWGINGNNDSEFAGVVSDGSCGAAAFEFNRGKVKARKAYFAFDGGMICLGNGIESTAVAPVETTVNQLLDSNGKLSLINSKAAIWQNVAYLSLIDKFDKDTRNGVSWLGYKHGKKPSAAHYAYIVLPNMNKKKLQDFAQNNPVKILANNESCQAVSIGKNCIMAVFYRAGILNDEKGKVMIKAKLPLLVMKRNNKIWAASPYGYKWKVSKTDIVVGNKKYIIKFPAPILEKGRSIKID